MIDFVLHCQSCQRERENLDNFSLNQKTWENWASFWNSAHPVRLSKGGHVMGPLQLLCCKSLVLIGLAGCRSSDQVLLNLNQPSLTAPLMSPSMKFSPCEGTVFNSQRFPVYQCCEGLSGGWLGTVWECWVQRGTFCPTESGSRASHLSCPTGESVGTHTQGTHKSVLGTQPCQEGHEEHKRQCFIYRQLRLFHGGSSKKVGP